MAEHVLAIDQGTTSTRAIVFDATGSVVSVAQREHEQIMQRAGRVEHDPIEIWTNVEWVTSAALSRADLARQRHRRSRRHEPARDRDRVGPAHRATGAQCAGLAGHAHPASDRRAHRGRRRATGSPTSTGLPLATYFSASKIAWILEHVARCARRRRGR